MMVVSIHTHPEHFHVYVTTWARGATYPRRDMDLYVDRDGELTGRAVLTAAVRALMSELDAMDSDTP